MIKSDARFQRLYDEMIALTKPNNKPVSVFNIGVIHYYSQS